ncbi:MAG: hypothetical protein ABIR58_06675 [Gemmatimonadaceae bacterium]
MTDSRTIPRWRLLLAPPRPAAENMARDTTLMDRARSSGEAVFSVYSWERPTLSLGRNQTARGRFDAALLRTMGMDVVRRPTGGRALVHHREITYSVVAPMTAATGARHWYASINGILLHALGLMGIDAAIADPGGRTLAVDESPCFAEPAPGEIVASGKKLVGSAQWRSGETVLQHGSILIENDQSMIDDVSLHAIQTRPVPDPATLTSLLGRTPATEEVAAALFAAVRALEDSAAAEIQECEVRPSALERIARFEDERWTWRR